MRRQATLKTLGVLVAKCKAEQRNLTEQRASLELKINKLESDIDSMTRSIEIVEHSQVDFVSTPQAGTLTEQVTNLVEQLLADQGPLHRRELLRLTLESGIHFGSEDQLNTFASYLARDERFVSNGHGVWRLASSDDQPDPVKEDRDDENDEKGSEAGEATFLSLVK